MSGNPYDKAHELARALVDSDVYHDYIRIRTEVNHDSGLQERIIALHELQLDINRAHLLGEDPPGEKVQEAALQFARLNQDARAAAYFQAEARFIQMFSDIQEIIQRAIDPEKSDND